MNLTTIKSRKVISVLLSVLMVLSLFPFAALLSYASGPNDWKIDVGGKWKFEVIAAGTPDEEVVLKDYLGDETELTIPETVKAKDTGDLNVTVVGADSAFGLENVKKLTIPAGIKRIGKYAFSDFKSLTTVEFLKRGDGTNDLTEIGDYAFQGDSKLSEISLPEGISKINNNTFEGCSSLKTMQLPTSVSSIGEHAFENCTALSSIKLSDYTTDIAKFAFKGSGLKTIKLSSESTIINEGVFMNCTSLESISIPSKVKTIDKNAFNGCSSLKSLNSLVVGAGGSNSANLPDYVAISDTEVSGKVTIPTTATVIGGEELMSINRGAFKGCSSLGPVVIVPKQVTNFGGSAFENCSSLKKIVILSDSNALNKSAIISAGESLIGSIAGNKSIGDTSFSLYGVKAFSGVADGFTIYGYEDTDAKFEAVRRGVPFVALDLKGISVNRKSVQDAYTVGQPFDPSGLTIDAEFYPNSPHAAAGKKNITQQTNPRALKNPDFDGFTVSNVDTSTKGIKRAMVSYEGKSTQTKIKITDPFITGITISKMPKTMYFVNDKFTTGGLELTAKYSDGSTKKITTGFTATTPDTSKVGKKTVTITYMGKTTTYEIQVDVKKLKGIKIDTAASKTSYKLGEKFDSSKIKVYAVYNNGVEELITNFTTATPDMNRDGKQVVRVSYGGMNTAFNIYVAKEMTMYRLYNPINHEHFYTNSAYERDTLKKSGWVYEGVAWIAPSISSTPVYRLYNPISRDHHYTTGVNERDTLVKKHGYVYEGIGWYSDDSKGVALYRQFCPYITTGRHNYTTSAYEKKVLTTQRGWKDEGIGWYGIR